MNTGFQIPSRPRLPIPEVAVGLLVSFLSPLHAGLYANTWSPGTVPWPGGTVPYAFDAALSPAQQQTYLNGLRDWELAGQVQFVPRTSQTQYILLKPSAPRPPIPPPVTARSFPTSSPSPPRIPTGMACPTTTRWPTA